MWALSRRLAESVVPLLRAAVGQVSPQRAAVLLIEVHESQGEGAAEWRARAPAAGRIAS